MSAGLERTAPPSGSAYVMNAKGRPGVDRLQQELAVAGEVETEELTLLNSYGKTELLLTTFRRRR